MPVINEMFPGTSKFRPQLQEAYDLLVNMRPAYSKKAIVYKLIHDDNTNDTYMGAEDFSFRCSWNVALGKEVVKEKGVNLTQAEIVANCLVNLCLLGDYPKQFEEAHQALLKG